MELPRSSLEALLSALRPTETPTHEAIEDLRNSGVGRSLRALWQALTPVETPTREEIENLRDSAIVWLRSRGQMHQSLHADDAMSALEALARLRLVSYRAWLSVVEGLWPVQIQQLLQWAQLEKKWELGLEFCPTSRMGYILGYEHLLRSHTSNDALKDPTGIDYSNVAIPVRLVLRSLDPAMWEEACEAAETARDRLARRWQDSDPQLAPLYRFVDAQIDSIFISHSWPLVEIWRRFAACGVRVLAALVPDLTWLERSTVHCVIPLTQSVLATTTTRTQDHQQFSGLSHVQISMMSDDRVLQSGFSLIVASQSVRELTALTASDTSAHRGGRDRAWKWLAVVLHGGIDVLTLDCERLAVDDVCVLEDALRAPNPLSQLFPSTMIPVDETEDVFVASAQRFHLHPPPGAIASNNSDSLLIYDAPLENLRVISVDDAWVSVLLPGWGRAWVSHADVSLSQMEKQSKSSQRCCSPRRLSLTNLRIDQAPVILALLLHIGNHVTAISISSRHFVSAAPFLEAVMQACPLLEELAIKDMSLPTLSIFTSGYEQRGLRVQQLVLTNVDVGDLNDCVQFFHSLADLNHPMARQLRVLSCTTISRAEAFLAAKPAILQMLRRNQQLDEFQLNLGERRQFINAEDMILQKELDQLNEARLPLRRKLALVSVMSSHTNHSQACSIRWLDRHVLAMIFEFASRVRYLRIHYSEDNNARAST